MFLYQQFAVILKADVAAAGVVFISDIELVRRAIGPAVRNGPGVEVRAGDLAAVHVHTDYRPVARNDQMVPCADGLHGVFRRPDEVVKCAGVSETGGFGIINGDFNPVVTDVLAWSWSEWERADEDAGIAMGTDFEIE